MKWKDLLVDGYSRVPEFLENVVKGLNQDDLDWQPRHDCNSIGWLIWHLTRQQDAQIASLAGGNSSGLRTSGIPSSVGNQSLMMLDSDIVRSKFQRSNHQNQEHC